MLYERWRQIANEHRNEIALHDVTSDRRWTFTQLAAKSERWSPSFSLSGGTLRRELQPALQFPQGNSAEFILAVLRGWRENKIICPLDLGQSAPSLTSLPTGCVHLKTTSATTGAPRVIAFTGEQLAADAHNIVATMGLRPDWPNLGVISLAHSYGFSNLVLPLLLHGIPLMLTGSTLPEMIRSATTLSESLTSAAVPALWRTWHDSGAIPPNVRLAISAGAPLPLPLEQAVFADSGLKIHNFYGSSECGGIAYDTTKIPRTDAACVGSPMRNVSLSLADDGCLEVRSRAVGETYWPQPDANLGGGCFHTSDLAEIVLLERGRSPSAARGQGVGTRKYSASDEDLHPASRDGSRSDILVYLRGRAGDQINVAGRKVSPETIERALLKHPQVLECVVFGVPSRDAQRTEEIVAVVVCDRTSTPAPKSSPSPRSEARGEGRGEGQPHGSSLGVVKQAASSPQPSPPKEERQIPFRESEGLLRQFMLETLPAWQAPRHWWFVEAVQTNPRGKVSRAEWRERWLCKK